jgi:PAS domain S-box-containing protein
MPIVPPHPLARDEIVRALEAMRGAGVATGRPKPSLARALQRAEGDERYARILADLRAAVTEFDQEGRIVYVSPNIRELSGFSPEELIGEPAHLQVHDDDLPRLLVVAECIAAGERAPRTRFRSKHRDGHWIWNELLSSTRFTAEDGGIHTLTVSRDISEQHDAEEARRVSDERYRAIAEASRDMLFEIDGEDDRRPTFISSRAAATIGYSLEQMLELARLSAVHADDRPRVAAAIDTCLASGQPLDLETFRVRRADGTWLHWEGRGIPYRRGNGERRLILILRDVSDRLRQLEEQRRLEERVQQAQRVESLGVLAGGIAHDFNNLLTPILGDAHLALEDLPAGSKLRVRLERIARAAERASKLTAQMLAYAGAEPIARESVDLSALVREVGALVAGNAAARTEIRYELARGLPLIVGDASQLTQVALNLITNAIEAVPEGRGRVDVRTGLSEFPGRIPRGVIVGEAPPPGLCIYLEVEDNGCGIDAETRAKIFDPFFTTKFRGRGLGLAAVLGSVRAHAGCIEIESEPERGTRFRALFPCGNKRLAPA